MLIASPRLAYALLHAATTLLEKDVATLLDAVGDKKHYPSYAPKPPVPDGSTGKLVFLTNGARLTRTIEALWGPGGNKGLKVTRDGVNQEAAFKAPKNAHFLIRKDIQG